MDINLIIVIFILLIVCAAIVLLVDRINRKPEAPATPQEPQALERRLERYRRDQARNPLMRPSPRREPVGDGTDTEGMTRAVRQAFGESDNSS